MGDVVIELVNIRLFALDIQFFLFFRQLLFLYLDRVIGLICRLRFFLLLLQLRDGGIDGFLFVIQPFQINLRLRETVVILVRVVGKKGISFFYLLSHGDQDLLDRAV